MQLKIFLREKLIFVFVAVSLFLSLIDFGNVSIAAQNEAERKALEDQLTQVEAQIEAYQKTVDQYKTQGKTLQGEITQLNTKINKLNLQIKAINLSIASLDGEISSTQDKITATENDIEKNKLVLSAALQNIYENEKMGVIEVMLKNPKLSDFFNDLNSMMDVQDSIKSTLTKIIDLRKNLIDQKDQLADKKSDAVALRADQLSQKNTVASTKSQKDTLLTVTKGQESKYQELVKESKKTAAQIRAQIFKTLGGGELKFEEAYKIAKLAQDATGVRAALILAVLNQETGIGGVIGSNLGKCYYNDTWKNPEGTVMRSREATAFVVIMQDLGLDPAKTPVSCPINRDGLYGGAMGPAQFMPTTWKIYSSRITEITGLKASPFNNADAFMATALYLKDAGAANATLSQERIAAARYYAGGNYKKHIWGYGDAVVTRAQNIQEDIDVLTGQ